MQHSQRFASFYRTRSSKRAPFPQPMSSIFDCLQMCGHFASQLAILVWVWWPNLWGQVIITYHGKSATLNTIWIWIWNKFFSHRKGLYKRLSYICIYNSYTTKIMSVLCKKNNNMDTMELWSRKLTKLHQCLQCVQSLQVLWHKNHPSYSKKYGL